MSKYWLILPVVQENHYPKSLRDLAKRLQPEGVTLEQIAEKQGILPENRIQKIAFHQAVVEMIFSIDECPDNPKQSIIFCDEAAYLINLPIERVVKMYDKFMDAAMELDDDDEDEK